MKRKVRVYAPCIECGDSADLTHMADGGDGSYFPKFETDYQQFEDGGLFTDSGEMKKGGHWMQKVDKSIKKRGTEGKCSGSNFGGPGCPKGSRQYNLAVTFRRMAKARKKQLGGATAEQNMDITKFGQERINYFKNFLATEARTVIAEDTLMEASNANPDLFQFGGTGDNLAGYGYKDDGRQEMFQDKVDELNTQRDEAFSNLFGAVKNVGFGMPNFNFTPRTTPSPNPDGIQEEVQPVVPVNTPQRKKPVSGNRPMFQYGGTDQNGNPLMRPFNPYTDNTLRPETINDVWANRSIKPNSPKVSNTDEPLNLKRFYNPYTDNPLPGDLSNNFDVVLGSSQKPSDLQVVGQTDVATKTPGGSMSSGAAPGNNNTKDNSFKGFGTDDKTGFTGQSKAGVALGAAIDFATMIGNNRDKKGFEQEVENVTAAENAFSDVEGDKGFNMINSTGYNPGGADQKRRTHPIQFTGQYARRGGPVGRFQEGGEYELSDEEINDIVNAGGEIQYID